MSTYKDSERESMCQSTIYATQFNGEAVVVVLKNFIFIKFREARAHGNEYKMRKKMCSIQMNTIKPQWRHTIKTSLRIH